MVLKIVLYSIGYSEGLLRQLPYVRHFVERSLCHLSDLRDPGTQLVLVTPEPVDPSILTYHFRDLYGFDPAKEASARERLLLLTPELRAPLPLADLVLDDAGIMACLRDRIRRAKSANLHNFSPSAVVDLLAERLGIPVEEGPFKLSQTWGQQGGQQANLCGERRWLPPR